MSEPNPAIVPDPVEPEPREYEVLGQHAVLGHEPGEKFTAVLDPEQEGRMLARGSLRFVDGAAGELLALTRPELNTLAADLGVENPEGLPKKQAVIDAINEAREGAETPAEGDNDDTPGGVD